MSVTSILAIGMVLVIVAGQIDLSVGALAGLLGAISAFVFVNKAWPLWAAFAAALALGAVLGFLQGALVARLGIPPFIVTLGGMLIFQGALLGSDRRRRDLAVARVPLRGPVLRAEAPRLGGRRPRGRRVRGDGVPRPSRRAASLAGAGSLWRSSSPPS